MPDFLNIFSGKLGWALIWVIKFAYKITSLGRCLYKCSLNISKDLKLFLNLKNIYFFKIIKSVDGGLKYFLKIHEFGRRLKISFKNIRDLEVCSKYFLKIQKSGRGLKIFFFKSTGSYMMLEIFLKIPGFGRV